MAKSLSPSRRLAAFRARLAPIETLFAMGRINPTQRRDLLSHARDLTGIPTMPANNFGGGNEPAPPLSQDAYNLKRREENRRRRARKRADREAQAAGMRAV